MFKYRVGLNSDPESNAMARSIEDELKAGKTVFFKNLPGFVEGIAWPDKDGKKDRTGYSIMLMDHGCFLVILYHVIKSRILNEGYYEFGWGDIEFTDE